MRHAHARFATGAGLALFLLAGVPAGTPRAAEESPLDAMRRLVASGSYAQAEALAREHLEREEQAGHGESGEAAETLLVLVESLWRGGKEKDPETRRLAERCTAICGKAFGERDERYAASLANLGMVFRRIDDPESAKTVLRNALAIREVLFGPDSREVALTLNGLAVPEAMTGNFDAARALWERSIAIYEQRGALDVEAANILYNLGTLSDQFGDYAKSREYHERGLAIRRASLPKDHPLVAASAFALGVSLTRLGDLSAARALYEQALAAQEKTLGPDHPELAESLNTLAVVLARTGHYADARPLQERALRILERALGSDHSRVSEVRSDIAALMMNQGDYAGAKRTMQATVASRERVLGSVHPDRGRSLNRLADAELRLGEFASAEAHFQEARAILEKAYGPDHPDVAASLDGMGRLRFLSGRYVEAESFQQQALAVRRSRLGPDHPVVAEQLTSLARTHWALGRARNAFAESLEAEEILRAHFGRSLRGLSEREALEYETARSSGLNTALSVLAATPHGRLRQDSVTEAWMALVRCRALVLDQMAGLHRDGAEGESPGTAAVYRDLVAATNRLAALIVRGPEAAHAERYLPEVRKATREKEALERRVSQMSAPLKARLGQAPATFADLRAALPDGTALVAYVVYEQSDPGASRSIAARSYMAFVLGSDLLKPPVSLRLGPAAEIDRLVDEWREATISQSSSIGLDTETLDRRARDVGSRLRSAIWDPVAHELGGAARVLVVPDAAIHAISIAALPAGADRYLVESGPVLHYLSTERDLLALARARPAGGRGIMALGGPDFDSGPTPSTAPAADPRPSAGRRYRGPSAACAGFRALRFEPLPASAGEIADLREIMGGSDLIELAGADATEEAFKRQAPGRRVLHLATHGFFLDDACPSLLRAPDATDGPLLLSGLALAGANRRSEAAPGSEDGILTAEEIAALDLSQVEWTVLSACDSGLGKVQTGEGVLGLRRAFQLAGVRTLITSLWKVEDDTTREWMKRLYDGRHHGMSTADAVRQASIAVLEARRARGVSTSPFFWGAFTAAGDWR